LTDVSSSNARILASFNVPSSTVMVRFAMPPPVYTGSVLHGIMGQRPEAKSGVSFGEHPD
jgi:hypothetical protein